MPQDSAHFDDPGLKVALRTLQSGQTAPSAVRDRLRARLTAARGELDSGSNDESQSQPTAAPMPAPKKQPSRIAAGPPVPQSVPPLRIAGTEADRKVAAPVVASRPGFRIGPWLALAATIAICLGTGMVVLHYRQLQEQREIYAANDELLDAMIDVQQDNAAGKSIGASLPAPLSDPVALSSAAGRELGRKVPVVDFKPQGWKLESASFCEVHKLASVQFHFTRNGGKQHMTVLSMPASAWANAKDGSHYELTADGHPIAGFIRSGSLNCVVGDTALSSGDAVILRDAMRS